MDEILREIIANGGFPLKVGGCVRDKILGLDPKDIDVEVYNLSVDKLVDILSSFGEVDSVGKSFGVLKLRHNDTDIDFSVPRLEAKFGVGHKGFIIESDPFISVEQASLRRDFTINTMSEDIDGNLIDPFHGQSDLLVGILRATSSHFSEDPLRVLRGFQFCSRFNLYATPTTLEMCYNLRSEYDSLPKERVFGEWYKWAEKCKTPSLGIWFLRDCGWLPKQIENLINLPQDPEWHPEGDVFVHTCHVLDAMAEICYRKNIRGENKVILMFAALCHDFGKVTHTQISYSVNDLNKPIIRSNGHDVAGVEPARLFLESIGCFPRIIDKVLPLVREHMVHCYGPINIKRLSNRLFPATISELISVIEADHSGRPPLEKGLPESCRELESQSREFDLLNNKPQPIVKGRHLIVLGLKPSKQFKEILDDCYSKQLDGVFDDLGGGLDYLQKVLK